jgi:hypothetical protein
MNLPNETLSEADISGQRKAETVVDASAIPVVLGHHLHDLPTLRADPNLDHTDHDQAVADAHDPLVEHANASVHQAHLMEGGINQHTQLVSNINAAIGDLVDNTHIDQPEQPQQHEVQELAQQSVMEEDAIWEPAVHDVLSGRGASVNAHEGNKKFRAFSFIRKPEFEAANHAAKRRIATEIVTATVSNYGSRFLKRKVDKGPWYEMTMEQAILKACQVMRDHRRPDRIAQRELSANSGKKRVRATTTPLDDLPLPPPPCPDQPIVENPYGVHEYDILCGRGAYVNGHVGNARLRHLALERKAQFDSANYTEKRALATEMVTIIRSLEPPGRFLKRVDMKTAHKSDNWILPPKGVEGAWEELADEKAIHKACQVMRDIDRPDRREREERRKLRKLRKHNVDTTAEPLNIGISQQYREHQENMRLQLHQHSQRHQDPYQSDNEAIPLLEDQDMGASSTSEAVDASVVEAMDRVFDGMPDGAMSSHQSAGGSHGLTSI